MIIGHIEKWAYVYADLITWRILCTVYIKQNIHFHQTLKNRLFFFKVRNFSSIKVHCNNMFSKDVRVFRMAKIFFTVGGKYYTQEPVVYEYMRDTLMEFARWVIIPIPYRIARFVKLQLFFDARWIMIGEIQLESGKWVH